MENLQKMCMKKGRWHANTAIASPHWRSLCHTPHTSQHTLNFFISPISISN